MLPSDSAALCFCNVLFVLVYSNVDCGKRLLGTIPVQFGDLTELQSLDIGECERPGMSIVVAKSNF